MSVVDMEIRDWIQLAKEDNVKGVAPSTLNSPLFLLT